MKNIQQNFSDIKACIHKACDASKRPYGDVHLVAVSKKQPEDRIEAALSNGHRVFGENRVQEAKERWQERRLKYPDLKLHLIGPLQTNKVKDAVALFDVIETIDREKLARKLADEMNSQNRDLPCFIQINTGDEDQKAGVHPLAAADFIDFCHHECGLDIVGLMCIPPNNQPPAPHFALLHKLAQENGLKHLSMGMSGDFEKAIALGATYVRLGSALFGDRIA